MTIQQMRNELLKLYPSSSWKARVAKMPDAQVQAIYFRLKKTGAIK